MKLDFNFEDISICKACGGKCCERFPGIYHPKEICRMFPAKTLEQSVILAIRTKQIVIDWWEPDENFTKTGYFLRPRNSSDKGDIKSAGSPGKCIFLLENGCIHREIDRPYQCRALMPSAKGICVYADKSAEKLSLVISWDICKWKMVFLEFKAEGETL